MDAWMQDIENGLFYGYGKKAEDAGLKALYTATSRSALERVRPQWQADKPQKAACYFSAEFLLGRMVYANLYNMGLLEDTKAAFARAGLDPALFEQVEDAALGNGGLGRLAACFLDSGATLGLRLDGYGIRYQYGLFKQSFVNGFQHEAPDDWERFGDPWSERHEEARVWVQFGSGGVWAVPYDMPIIGYGAKTVNNLRLWQAEAAEAFNLESFSRQDYAAAYRGRDEADAIHAVLYPNDDTDAGKMLRLKQQYFFSSASLQSILRDFVAAHGTDFAQLPEYYAIQLNDTHPTISIPELLRLLMEGYNLPFDEAADIARRLFAYTNHTVLAEALEKWDVRLFMAVAPAVYPYVVMLDNALRRDLLAKGVDVANLPEYEILAGGQVHMARMAIYATHSTNGVAALHTQILKDAALHEWYVLYPERFNNKTNGITQRRWLGLANPALAQFITARVGDGWLTDLNQLEGLRAWADDENALRELHAIKQANKARLAEYIQIAEGRSIRADSLFDVQIKRLHEYKRQLLNAFSILDLYYSLKDGTLEDFAPMTFLFGAKAAPGYRRAKGIIKFINEIAHMIEADAALRDTLRVVFVQDYNVSYAERLVPAADLSEQVSTAGTEASGTGNMKLMLNGAVTLGTYDGANVEIVAAAGEENNYIFGARVEEIRAMQNSYNPRALYEENPRIRRVVDTLVDGTLSDGGTGLFRELYTSLLDGTSWHRADNYFLLHDFEGYVDAKLRANRDSQDTLAFSRKCLLNIAAAGRFSSDRTVAEYAKDIWGLG